MPGVGCLDKDCALTSADVTQDLSPVEAIVGEELARAARALARVAPV